MAPWGLSLPEWGRGSGNGKMWRCKDEMRSPAPAFRAAAPFLEHPVMFLKHRGVRVSLIRSVQTGSAFLPLHPHHHSLPAGFYQACGCSALVCGRGASMLARAFSGCSCSPCLGGLHLSSSSSVSSSSSSCPSSTRRLQAVPGLPSEPRVRRGRMNLSPAPKGASCSSSLLDFFG